jgi:hypothetical protein
MPRRRRSSEVSDRESPRGVFIDHANQRIRAVTSKNRRIALRTFFNDEEIDAIVAELYVALDRVDPLVTDDVHRLPPSRYLRLV